MKLKLLTILGLTLVLGACGSDSKDKNKDVDYNNSNRGNIERTHTIRTSTFSAVTGYDYSSRRETCDLVEVKVIRTNVDCGSQAALAQDLEYIGIQVDQQRSNGNNDYRRNANGRDFDENGNFIYRN